MLVHPPPYLRSSRRLLPEKEMNLLSNSTASGPAIDSNWTIAGSTNGTIAGTGDAVSAQNFAIGWMCLLALCLLARSPAVDDHHRRGSLMRIEAQLRRRRQQRMERMADPEFRKSLIRRSLTVKRIVGVDGDRLQLGEYREEEVVETTIGDDEDSVVTTNEHAALDSGEEESSCVICLETFVVNDVVTWSKTQKECRHVYHNDCLTEWLDAKHDDCPSCRAVLLHYNDQHDSDVEEDAAADNEDAETGLFVIMNGLVSTARRASYSLLGQTIDEESPEVELPHRKRSLSATSENGRRRSSGLSILRAPLWRRSSLQDPIGLRRVVSAGPGSPIRPKTSPKTNDDTEERAIPMRRVSSSGMRSRRNSSVREWAECDEDADLEDEDSLVPTVRRVTDRQVAFATTTNEQGIV